MANEEHLKILKQGVGIWNRWREENPDIRPELSGADFRRVDLSGANFSEANISGADLTMAILVGGDLRGVHFFEADLREAYLSGANLRWANLRRAGLIETDLHGAYLRGADLRNAHLNRANLHGADLSGANLNGAYLSDANLGQTDLREADLRSTELSGTDFNGAKVGYTVFGDLDLSVVKGLDTVDHSFPSTVGIDTIFRSRGHIPETFLHGAGVPNHFIAYAVSLTSEATPYYSCFISYSTCDQAFAQRLHTDLQAKGVRCWFAPEDVVGGKKLYEQIDQAIRMHDKLLLVLSEHSIGSQWVMTEIRRTRKAELRGGRQKLFPIRLVDWGMLEEWECVTDSGEDLAARVREYFIPDFSNWENHAAYKPAFDRLLRDLKAEEG
jgi:hypothetical protein